MAFSKELIFVVAFLIHTNAAINLNIFNFNRGARPNVTTESIPITSTGTVSASIKVTQTPVQIVNYSLPDLNVHVDTEKHEFENETEAIDASPENTDDVKPPSPIPGGQEIDETRNSSRYFVNETVEEGQVQKVSTTKLISTTNKSDTVKLNVLPKKKTVTFTTTVVSKFTKYETVYPSCVKKENVKSICDGKLITIQPTPTILNAVNEKTTVLNNTKDEYFDDNFDIIEPPEIRKKRAANGTETPKNLKELDNLGRLVFIEPSEMDYDFEVIDSVATKNSQGGGTQPIAKIESILASEPKLEFATAYLISTSVQTVTNYDITATVIAYNCLPRNINLKECPKTSAFVTKHPILPVTPISTKKEITKSKTKQDADTNEKQRFFGKPSPSPPPQQKPHKSFDTIDELNQYLIMNGHRLIHSNGGGYETIDLNAGSTIIEPSLEQSSFQSRKKPNRVKRER